MDRIVEALRVVNNTIEKLIKILDAHTQSIKQQNECIKQLQEKVFGKSGNQRP